VEAPHSFASKDAWAAWLAEHHASAPELWVKIAKKGSRVPGVTYVEAVEAALTYGWIDGQARSVDDDFFAQRFSPRRARSGWSKINQARATRLIESGEMQAAGLREVERAKADGRWDGAYDSPSVARIRATS
jgi:uncharacterized protein YdeI (YjbR/CyaY-like superfamily)